MTSVDDTVAGAVNSALPAANLEASDATRQPVPSNNVGVSAAAGVGTAAGQAPDAFRLDRPSIRTSFDRASANYEAAAVLQAQVNQELMTRLEFFKFQPEVVLDLGTGTGRGAEELKRRYRKALVVALDMAPGMLRKRKSVSIFSAASSACARTRCDCRLQTPVLMSYSAV